MTTETINWTELLVSDTEGATGETLGSMAEAAPSNLDSAVLDSAGRINEWPDFLLSAEGEEADWDTPRVAVNWDGLAAKLGR